MTPLEFVEMAKGRPLAVDTETNGADIRDGRGYAVGTSVAFEKEGKYYRHYFPFNHRIGDNYDQGVLNALKVLLESCEYMVFHNAKFDLVSLQTLGIDCWSTNWYCTMIMAHLVDENWPRSKSLDNVSKTYLGPEFHKEMPAEMRTIIDSFGWDCVPSEMMRGYAEQDAELPLRIIKAIWAKYAEETIPSTWDWKRRFIRTVAVMESRGVEIDQEFCARELEKSVIHKEDYMEMIGGFNPASFKDMYELLCVRLGLPPLFHEVKIKNKETGKYEKVQKQTFNAKAMEQYERMLENHGESDLAKNVLAYRGWSKAASAMYGPYLRFLSPDGRLRPTYHHHKDEESGGTVTGRLSCSDPNLQQIPRSGDQPWNGNVKKSFRAKKGFTLWEVDFSQLELRVATTYSGEQSLMDVFNEGRDIFTEMAEVFGKSRDLTKKFVYMTQYAAGPEKIALDIGVLLSVAREMRKDYYGNYPGFRNLDETLKQMVLATKRIRIWTGRYRHFRNPKEENHKAMNSLIQGGSADIVERQMVRIFEEIDQKSDGEVRMLLTVHDSVWFEIKKGRESYWLPKIKALMSDVGGLSADFNVVRFHVEEKQL